ncbi:MAG: hypothetical protein RIC55_32385 [Pirellulaceae bacterium]
MPENPYQSPKSAAVPLDDKAVAKAEQLPFRCALGGASIGSAFGALSAVLLKVFALILISLEGDSPRRPPDYRQQFDTIWGLIAAFVPELVVEIIVGTVIGIVVGALVGGFLGTIALFLTPRAVRFFPWLAAFVGAPVGGLLGYVFGASNIAEGGMELTPIPLVGGCLVGLLGLMAGALFGRGVRRRIGS